MKAPCKSYKLGCGRYARNRFHEQACAELLLGLYMSKIHPYLQSKLFQENVELLPGHMNHWNGPWGEFFRHLWSGIQGRETPRGKGISEDFVLSFSINVNESIQEIETHHVRNDLIDLDFHCESQ